MNIEEITKAIEGLPAGEQEGFMSMLSQYENSLKRERAQKNFMVYVKEMWPGFVNGRHHKVMAKKFEDIAEGKLKRLIICMPPRHAIMTSMKIPTLLGMKTMADLTVGDFVFGPDGKPVEVLGKSEVFKDRELYRVWTDDNAYLDVDGEHLWTVRLDRKHNIYKDYTTEQLWRRQNGEILKTTSNGKVVFLEGKAKNIRLPRLPDVHPVEYPHKMLTVDPYLLGVWLGDGSRSSGVISAKDDDAVFTRARIEASGYKTTDQSTKYTFGVLQLQNQLKEIGVYKNKHIPRDYLESSVKQRRELLKGLMDTDGNVSKQGQCFFAQSNVEFIEQAAELVRSLGIKANILESEAKIGDKSYGTTWKLSFYASDVFNLPRKEERTLKNQRTFGRYIKIEKLHQTGNTQCIRVDREDGLFLAGEGYICTHNTKSEFASYLLPSWFLGKFPDKKVIQSSNTADLAVGFGRKVRNLVDSEQYSKVFPNVGLRSDSKAAGRWSTNHNGEYFAIGVGGTVTGKGADLLIIDDPHSEQEAKLAQSNSEVFDQVYEWYTSGPRQRLQPGGAIVIVQTRWSKKDLVGRILQSSIERDGETWELIEFPAILPSGNPLWPEFWSYDELAALRDELPAAKWNAQYQQSPTSEEGALIKREWWKEWEKEDPPKCDYLLQSWDTAFSKSERADYSACTTWGVFYPNENPEDPNIILLDAFKKRMEFPELKEIALRYYKEWEPDSFIVEAKASGAPLIYELRAMGIPVQEFTPTRGNDKIVRVNAISDLFASGKVWAPPKRWAEEVIEELAAFPNAQHDDFVDSCLVGETTVLMADKTYKRIDQINIGDFVITPNGSRRVTAVFDNGQKEVWKVKVGNCVLYATANHKIKTTKGWLRVDCLSQANYNGYIFNGDLLWLLQNKTMLNLNQLFLMVENTIVTLKAQTLHTANILQERVTGFIGIFGCSIRAIFQKVMKFTTLTRIQPTMTFQTWSVWKENCIKKNTPTKCRNEGNCHNNWSILPTLDLKRRLGIPQKKALLGTNSTPKILLAKHGAFQKHMLNFKQRVFGAAALLWQKFSLKNIAQPAVNRQSQNIAPVNLAQNTHSIQNVYDITVEGEHCYYANNILVHNCSQALLRFRKGGFIRLQTDEIDEPRSFRRKGAYY